jgi:hypothetical protein
MKKNPMENPNGDHCGRYDVCYRVLMDLSPLSSWMMYWESQMHWKWKQLGLDNSPDILDCHKHPNRTDQIPGLLRWEQLKS